MTYVQKILVWIEIKNKVEAQETMKHYTAHIHHTFTQQQQENQDHRIIKVGKEL